MAEEAQEIVIPETVTRIGGTAFSDCEFLTSVHIPAGVTETGGSAFQGCSALTSLSLPETVTSISEKLFCGCSSLHEVTLLGAVEKTEKDTFSGCAPDLAVIAPKTPLSAFSARRWEARLAAVLGFARWMTDSAFDGQAPYADEAAYLKYIKGQKKKLFPFALQFEPLLRLMLEQKFVTRNDLPNLLEQAAGPAKELLEAYSGT